MSLFPTKEPPKVPGIDLRCCDVQSILDGPPLGAALIVADPPWKYEVKAGNSDPEDSYGCLDKPQIAEMLRKTARHVKDGRLALWLTWPILADEFENSALRPLSGWDCISGGSWDKIDHQGVGHHWLGRSEPVLLFRRGTPPNDRSVDLGNSWSEIPAEHSMKPVSWQRAWLRRWTKPGDVVFDLFAGLGSVACACALEGREYAGAEIDPERHGRAMFRVRQAQRGVLT